MGVEDVKCSCCGNTISTLEATRHGPNYICFDCEDRFKDEAEKINNRRRDPWL